MYSSPNKNLKAARAAVEACDSLSGDALAKQQARVKELLDTIEAQNAEMARNNKAAIASQTVRSARNAGSKSHGQASSPHPDKRKERDVNAQQMTVYDPVLAGKQKAGQYNAGRKSQGAAHGYAGNDYAGKGEIGQNYRAPRAAYADDEMPPQRHPRGNTAIPN